MKFTTLLLLLAIGFAMPGCAFSKQGRQQRAYQKYVRKASVTRQKRRVKFRTGKPQMPTMPMPSEPMESTSSGPEAMPADASQ